MNIPQEQQSEDDWQPHGAPPPREPMFNLPAVILWLAGVLIAIHVMRVYFLSAEADARMLMAFAFIPARYGELASQLSYPMAAIWSPLSYAFLHGNWMHLWMNVLWMVAFGSPVARRLGPSRFLALSVIAALGGAALHYVFFAGEIVPVIGASAIVSGHMGAAARFAFHGAGPGGLNVHGPALSLVESFTNRKFLIFLGVWMALNLLFGTGIASFANAGAEIAWQAHIGGFAAGILCFSFLDRERQARG